MVMKEKYKIILVVNTVFSLFFNRKDADLLFSPGTQRAEQMEKHQAGKQEACLPHELMKHYRSTQPID